MHRNGSSAALNFRNFFGGHSVMVSVRQYRSCMMSKTATIIGVHEIEADEPVHLIEIEVTGDADQLRVPSNTKHLDRLQSEEYRRGETT
jgi:hypothetical protein